MLKISDCPVKIKVCRTNVQQKIKMWPLKKWAVKKLKNCSNWEKKGGGEWNGLYYVCPVKNNC